VTITETTLPKRRLVKGAKLAAVQPVPFIAKARYRLKADLKMGCDGFLIEFVCLTRQLDLAMQWLVRNAEQGAIRNPETVSLGRNRRALHLDRNRAALGETLCARGIEKLPIAIISGDDGARHPERPTPAQRQQPMPVEPQQWGESEFQVAGHCPAHGHRADRHARGRNRRSSG